MLEQREGGCHCGRVRFRARVDLDLLSQCVGYRISKAALAGTLRNGSGAPKADNDRELGSTTDEFAMNVIVQSSKDR